MVRNKYMKYTFVQCKVRISSTRFICHPTFFLSAERVRALNSFARSFVHRSASVPPRHNANLRSSTNELFKRPCLSFSRPRALWWAQPRTHASLCKKSLYICVCVCVCVCVCGSWSRVSFVEPYDFSSRRCALLEEFLWKFPPSTRCLREMVRRTLPIFRRESI